MLLTSPIFSAAVLTVCVEPKSAQVMVRAAEAMPWLVSSAAFEAYISEDRRPYFDPQIKSANGLVAVVDFDLDPKQAVAATRYLQQSFPGKISIAALSESHDPELLLRAMRAGCGEFLRKPVSLPAFEEMLARLDGQWTNGANRSPQGGAVLAFLGTKGGVGTTTLAVNLAIHLRQSHGKRVLLIDSTPALGHACLYLGLDGSRYHFNEVVRNVSRLDSELLHGFTAKHASGVEVLSSPDQCGMATSMDPDAIGRALEFLRGEYDYVIVDCDRQLDEAKLALLDAATRLYLIAIPEMGAIRDLSRYIERFISDETAEKLDVVINRSSARYAIHISNVERAIRRPITIRFPNSYADLVKPLNLGEPVCPAKDKSEFTQELTRWANHLAGASPAKLHDKKEASIFALWK